MGSWTTFIFDLPTAKRNCDYFHLDFTRDKEPRLPKALQDDGSLSGSGSEECGVVLTAQDETWDISSVEDLEGDLNRIGENELPNSQQREDPEELLTRLGSLMDGAIATVFGQAAEVVAGMVSSVSLSGRSSDVSEYQEECDSSFRGFCDEAPNSGKVRQLRNMIENETNEQKVESTPNRMITRSLGPVPEIPNVQSKILERKSKN